MRTIIVPRGNMPPVVARVECSGCTHSPHEPGKCHQRTLFTRETCRCTYSRDQVYTR